FLQIPVKQGNQKPCRRSSPEFFNSIGSNQPFAAGAADKHHRTEWMRDHAAIRRQYWSGRFFPVPLV
ncbi:hypothetical protein O4H48_21920, partial [Rhodobacteraceae bacterium G21628-S1]|nr:hypothetical protein [Rhodobacteraceae bacterium G21628-S1]